MRERERERERDLEGESKESRYIIILWSEYAFIIDVISTIIQCVTSGYMIEVKSSDVLVDYHLTNRLNSVHHYMYV